MTTLSRIAHGSPYLGLIFFLVLTANFLCEFNSYYLSSAIEIILYEGQEFLSIFSLLYSQPLEY